MQLEFVNKFNYFNIWIDLEFCNIPISYYSILFHLILVREPGEVQKCIFQVGNSVSKQGKRNAVYLAV